MEIEVGNNTDPRCTCVLGNADDKFMVVIDPDCPVHENKAVKVLEALLQRLTRNIFG